MEENKVKMTPKAGGDVKSDIKNTKPTDEQLREGLQKLYEENQFLRNKIQEAYKYINQLQVDNGFKRLDCLFKSLEYAHYFDNEFIDSIVNEIKDMIIIKDEDIEGSTDEEIKEEPTDERTNE